MLLEGLKRLEYRGYDSAGLAVINDAGEVTSVKSKGRVMVVENRIKDDGGLPGTIGIAHTRWATHGEPNDVNAHPHADDPTTGHGIQLVHNGIIENHAALKTWLLEQGHVFQSETDTEVLAHLIGELYDGDLERAVQTALREVTGAYAIAVICSKEPGVLVAARKGSPLAIGVGDGEMYLGSDALAVAPFTNRVIYLEEGDWCVLHRESYEIFDAKGHPVERPVTIVQGAGAAAEKGNYRHFMQKEIFEQPDSTARTIGAYLNVLNQTVTLPEENGEAIDWKEITSLQMVACGTAHYATRVAEYWFEQVAGIPVKTDIASEFRYRDPALPRTGGLAIFVSQSGETADTLAALRYCKAQGLKTAAVVNVPTSTIAREADLVLPTLAGPEIGVASTKAFTAQLSALAAVAISAGRAREMLSRDAEIRLVRALTELPRLISTTLALDERIEALARDIAKATDVIYLGRGVHYPIALEGALKLKEISYIHAEGYASGELKHGPIALIDEETPVVFVAPFDGLFDKSLSNLQEVAARRGEVILISDEAGLRAAGEAPAHRIELPDCDPFIAPILYSVPVQLLAYHVAVEKGTDVDQPRNLAKSVTVE